MKFLSRINDILLKIFNNTIALINISIVIMILTGAFMRYVLKKDFYGMEELVLMIAFWMYFLGSAVASYEGTQVSADLVSSLFKSDKGKSILILIRTLITLFLFAILTKWAYDYFVWSLEMRPATAVYKLPMAIAHASLLVSFIFSVIYELMHVCRAVIALNKAYHPQESEEIA